MNNEVLLFTTGLDSYICKEYLERRGNKFDLLYFNHKGRYAKYEIEKIQKYNNEVIICDDFDFSSIESDDAHIPNRNILFATYANSLGYKMIWIGGSLSDRVEDNNKSVMDVLSVFLSNMNKQCIQIGSPFWDNYKEEMIKWYISHVENGEKKLLTETFSCFKPLEEEKEAVAIIKAEKTIYNTRECLSCPACFRKCASLFSGEIKIKFNNQDIINKYYNEFSTTIETSPRIINTLKFIHAQKWIM